MPSSSERNTALENSLVESYRIAWNRLSFDGFEREAGILTITYSELLDTSVDTLFRFARDGRWLCETQIASITRQSLSSQNIRAAALCLANTATWLKRAGRMAEARKIYQLAEEFNDGSQIFRLDGQ